MKLMTEYGSLKLGRVEIFRSYRWSFFKTYKANRSRVIRLGPVNIFIDTKLLKP